jgi:hypothetical protein
MVERSGAAAIRTSRAEARRSLDRSICSRSPVVERSPVAYGKSNLQHGSECSVFRKLHQVAIHRLDFALPIDERRSRTAKLSSIFRQLGILFMVSAHRDPSRSNSRFEVDGGPNALKPNHHFHSLIRDFVT